MLKDKIKIGTLELNSRLVMPPLATEKSDADGNVTDELIAYYAERAKGGAIGLIITEHSFICPMGRASARQMSFADGTDPGMLRKLTDAIHADGTRCIAQISHSGSLGKPELLGTVPVGPSAVRNPRHAQDVTPRELSPEEINALKELYADAAQRAKEAGYDGVEIHVAHAYLLNEFYSPLTNKRTDCYGGCLDNRIRIVLEIIEKVRARVGADYPVAVRLGGCDYMDGGSTIEDAVAACVAFEKAGVDLLDLSGGICGFILPQRTQPGYFADMTAAIKRSVHIPVLLTGGITSAADAEHFLQEGAADLIGVGRALMKDADWARRELN